MKLGVFLVPLNIPFHNHYLFMSNMVEWYLEIFLFQLFTMIIIDLFYLSRPCHQLFHEISEISGLLSPVVYTDSTYVVFLGSLVTNYYYRNT
jgi:hypothetical protein